MRLAGEVSRTRDGGHGPARNPSGSRRPEVCSLGDQVGPMCRSRGKKQGRSLPMLVLLGTERPHRSAGRLTHPGATADGSPAQIHR